MQIRRGKFEHRFLPVSQADLRERGWDELDIVIISGDAYVDHPAFGPPLIARFLEGRGFKVGIIAQPDWRSVADFKKLGRPRLFFGISAGNMDSMLNRLTAQKKNRGEDQYSPAGARDKRPDRATIVYANRAREAYPDVPIVLGGIEASLRRIAHFDYWSESVRRSILLDAKADLLIFGMGERPVMEVAQRLAKGEKIEQLRNVRGTAFPVGKREADAIAADPSSTVTDGKVVVMPTWDDVKADKRKYAQASRILHYETNPYNARPLLQRDRFDSAGVYFNPPALPLETAEMDELYDLPFNRAPHPSYKDAPVPAFETVKHSLVIMRGCFGGCTFCSITEHEGRVIQSRSAESILREVRALRIVYATLRDEGAFAASDPAATRARAVDLLRRAWSATADADDAARAAALPLLDRIDAALRVDTLAAFIAADLRRLQAAGLVPVGFEVEREGTLDLPSGRRVVVEARFDRVAEGPGRPVIGDYKTGGSLERRVNEGEMVKGQEMQVPLYAILADAAVELLGVGARHRAGDEEGRFAAFPGFSSQALRDGFLETVDVLLGLEEAGAFPLHPDRHCAWCAYRPACRRTHPPTLAREDGAADSASARIAWSKTAAKPLLADAAGDGA